MTDGFKATECIHCTVSNWTQPGALVSKMLAYLLLMKRTALISKTSFHYSIASECFFTFLESFAYLPNNSSNGGKNLLIDSGSCFLKSLMDLLLRIERACFPTVDQSQFHCKRIEFLQRH